MSRDKETTDYIELRPGDKVQVGDQWLDQFGQWHFYTRSGNTGGVVNSGVKARRPIPATHQATYEEVPGSRTTQDTVVQPQRERIAYEELRPGTEVQAGDQYRNTQGRWVEYTMDISGVPIVGPTAMARRPYKIRTILEIGDALADAQKAATQLQSERDEARTERDLARSEVARLSTDLWARTPLEDRVSSLVDELAQARAELQRLQGVVSNLYNEPTARQVQQMLRTWATELDWSAGCFGSVGRDEIDTIQRTLIAVMERIETMLNPEGGTDGE